MQQSRTRRVGVGIVECAMGLWAVRGFEYAQGFGQVSEDADGVVEQSIGAVVRSKRGPSRGGREKWQAWLEEGSGTDRETCRYRVDQPRSGKGEEKWKPSSACRPGRVKTNTLKNSTAIWSSSLFPCLSSNWESTR